MTNKGKFTPPQGVEFSKESLAVAKAVMKIYGLPDNLLFYGFHIVKSNHSKKQFLLSEGQDILGSKWVESPQMATHIKDFLQAIQTCEILYQTGFKEVQMGLTYLKNVSKSPLRFDMLMILNKDQSWRAKLDASKNPSKANPIKTQDQGGTPGDESDPDQADKNQADNPRSP